MASKNIKGITIEIGGKSTELQKALQQPEKDAKNLNSELKEIDKSLKFNPDSLDLLAQRSSVLGSEVSAVSDKLEILRKYQDEIQAKAESGDIGAEQYRAFQREVLKTEDQLRALQNQLIDNDKNIDSIAGNTKSAADSAKMFESALKQEEAAAKSAKSAQKEHGEQLGNLRDSYNDASESAASFSDIVKASAIGNLVASGIKKGTSALLDFANAGAESAKQYEVSLSKLQLILRNTVNASDDYVESVKEVIALEEKYGVVSKEAQTAAAQELATYVTKKGTLEKLIPVLNDMIAQQYGVNASQEAAVSVATQLGKTLDGQVGSLQRWGYRFEDAEKKILSGNNEMRKADVIIRSVTDSVGGLSHGLRATTKEGELFSKTLDLGTLQQQFGDNVDSIKKSILIQLLPSFEKAIEVIDKGVVQNASTFENLGNIIATVINVFTNLLKVVTAIPAPILTLIAGVLLAVKTFTAAEKGLGAFNSVLSVLTFKLDPATIKILALVAAVSVLLFLILSLKEGTDKASQSMSNFGTTAGNIANQNVAAGKPRGYATGTLSAARGLAWVGEDGPELVNFRGGERVYTAAQSRRLAQSSTTQTALQPTNETYYDYRTLNIRSIDEFRPVVDWFNNREIRATAQ